MNKEEQKRIAEEWVKAGKPCTYRYGFAWKGAKSKRITQEKAEELLPNYNFGIGFYELCWNNEKGERVLCFNEYSENDMY